MHKDEEKETNDINLPNEEDFQDVEFVDSTEEGEALPTKDVVKKLREELKACRKEKEEYLTGWQRAKADYVNLKKELDESHGRSSILSKEKMMNNLIPALDSFDMAFQNKESWDKVDKNWRTGVEYIYTQLMNGLSDSGIEKIDKVGVKFDPSLHHSIEAIKTDDESKDHTVEKVIQVGYKIGDLPAQAGRVIRPARVNIYEFKKE